jgi:hypothetical protein
LSDYRVVHLDETDEISDGRCRQRPVRHHLGITAFGINAWTGREVGDRIINEHDEEDDGNEELYFVSNGRAMFEPDGERRVAPEGTFVFVPPAVKRTAFAEEAGTTLVAIGGIPGKPYEPRGWEIWASSSRSTRPASTPPWPTAGGTWSRPIPSIRCSSTTSRAARRSPAGRTTRSNTYGTRPTVPKSYAREESRSERELKDDR